MPGAAPAATATAGFFLAGPARPPAFLVEDEERTQADVGDLFFGESEFVIRHDVP